MHKLWPCLTLLLVIACGPAHEFASEEQDVVVDTTSELAWAQYRANFEYAQSYEPSCTATAKKDDTRPRVLVTGFGRFRSNRRNATGELVSELLEELSYPQTEPPPAGQVDPPEPQTAVAQGTITLDSIGDVALCAMVLPVFWDLSAVLVLAEIAAFDPDFVVMNGIAQSEQALWLELGAVNRAAPLEDGSGALAPVPGSPLIANATESEQARGNLLAWHAVREAAAARIETEITDAAGANASFGEILRGVEFARYPRASNTYLCNNTTYVVGYAMDLHETSVRLLEPSHPRDGFPSGLDVTLGRDHAATPRVFIHWPSALSGKDLSRGAKVLRSVIGAQLQSSHEETTRGDNAFAE